MSRALLYLIIHPFYFASYIYSIYSHLSEGDVCTLKDILGYRIGSVEWFDMTPLPSSPVARAIATLNREMLNLVGNVVNLF